MKISNILAIAATLISSTAFADSHNDWVKVCRGTGKDKICNIVKDVVTDYGQPLAIFNVVQQGKNNILQITVPTGRHLPEGISLQIGKNEVKKLDYSYCLGPSCVAQGEISSQDVNNLKNSDKIKIISVNFQGQSNDIETSLNNFAKAYDSKGITEKEFMEKRAKVAASAAAADEKATKLLLEAQKKVK